MNKKSLEVEEFIKSLSRKSPEFYKCLIDNRSELGEDLVYAALGEWMIDIIEQYAEDAYFELPKSVLMEIDGALNSQDTSLCNLLSLEILDNIADNHRRVPRLISALGPTAKAKVLETIVAGGY